MRKIIELKNITKAYDGQVVLDNISLGQQPKSLSRLFY